MLINIDKVTVKDRIRKDFGDIQELADDIRQNGLINPPVVNKDYELLAGERRLRACKALGWKQIEIRMMDTRDAEHELNVEISENENRKAFSKAERVDYMRRLMRIEAAKADERMKAGVKDPTKKSAEGETRQIVAEQFGVSHDTMRKEISIVDHKDLIDPADFADWDEGKLSTNKVFQQLKSKLSQTDREIKFYKDRINRLEREKNSNAAYEELMTKYTKKCNEALRLQEQIAELKETTQEGLENGNLSENVFYFCTLANNFVGNVGGLVWLTERINDMPKRERELFLKAAKALNDFSNVFTQNMERGIYGERNDSNHGRREVSSLSDQDEWRED